VDGGPPPQKEKKGVLDGERISVRIILFGLVVENSMRLVIFRKI
jgi:hypothetical protein